MRKKNLRIIALIAAMALFFCCGGSLVLAADTETVESTLPFDYDGDATRTTADAILLLRKIDGVIGGSVSAEDADVNGDGTVSVYDAIYFLHLLDYSLKVVSFNIKHGAMMGLDAVAAMLKEVDGDIVGIQEVDMHNTRSGIDVNQMEQLAAAAGYPYWSFTKAIDYQGGEYGHGILSKYPITAEGAVDALPQREGKEQRAIGRFEIDVNGKTLAFYNGHLDGGVGNQQFATAQNNYMVNDRYAIFVGDMNESPSELAGYIDLDRFVTLNGGEDLQTPVITTPAKSAIDHIILAKATVSYEKGETETGLYVVDCNGVSDHHLIYAYVNLID